MGKAAKILNNRRNRIQAKKSKVTDISKLDDNKVYTVDHNGHRITAAGRVFKEVQNKILVFNEQKIGC